MSYYSRVADITESFYTVQREATRSEWESFLQEPAVEYVTYFIYLEPSFQEQAVEGGWTREVLQFVEFSSGAAGKAYELEGHLTAFAQAFQALTGVYPTGSFTLAGEDYGDAVLYTFHESGTVTRQKGRMVFDGPPENLR